MNWLGIFLAVLWLGAVAALALAYRRKDDAD